jgi:hypothetical protein
MKTLKKFFSESSSEELINENRQIDPPNIIVLKRKAIRVFPDGKRVALYYADKIDQYISIPYHGSNFGKKDIVQFNQFNEEWTPRGNIGVLMQIIETGESQDIFFEDNLSMKIDPMTAQAIVNLYNNVNTTNKYKIERMVNKDKNSFAKVAAFAHGAHTGL